MILDFHTNKRYNSANYPALETSEMIAEVRSTKKGFLENANTFNDRKYVSTV